MSENEILRELRTLAAAFRKQFPEAFEGVLPAEAPLSALVFDDSNFGPDHPKYGLTVPFDPMSWKKAGKPSFAGQRLCDCPSEYLLELALVFDRPPRRGQERFAQANREQAAVARYFAVKNKGAALNGARGVLEAVETSKPFGDMDDLPF